MKKIVNSILAAAFLGGFILAVTSETTAAGIIGTIVTLAAALLLVDFNSKLLKEF